MHQPRLCRKNRGNRHDHQAQGRGKRSFDFILKQYKHKDRVAKLSNIPVLKKIGWRQLDMDNTVLTYVPIYENLELPAGTAAPTSIIEHFIRQASDTSSSRAAPAAAATTARTTTRFRLHLPGTRGALRRSRVGRRVSMEEALEHLQQATEAGLISCLGKFKFDAVMLACRGTTTTL